MTREELKGKQTPEGWKVGALNHASNTWVNNGREIVATCATPTCSHNRLQSWQEQVTEAEANAALIAEAGTVANRTGMWPEDLEQRVKELEDVAKACEQFVRVLGLDSQPAKELAENARTILNKKP